MKRNKQRLRGLVLSEHNQLKMYYSVTYVRASLTRYRAAAIDAFGPNHPVVDMLHPSQFVTVAVKKNYEAKVYANHQRLRPINPDLVIAAALQAIESGGYYGALAGAALLTGRRPVEVARQGQFEVAGKQLMRFKGQAKTKGAITAQTDWYDIPVLADAASLKELISQIQQAKAYLSNKEFNSRTESYLNAKIRRFFDPTNPDPNDRRSYNAQALRAMYACIAFDRRRSRRMSINAFYAKILGHAGTELATSHSYYRFCILGESNSMREEIERGDRQAVEDIKLLSSVQISESARSLIEERAIPLRLALKRSKSSPIGKVDPTSPKAQALARNPARLREILRSLTLPQTKLLRSIAAGKDDFPTMRGLDGAMLRRLESAKLIELRRPDITRTTIRATLTALGKGLAQLDNGS